MIAQDCQEIDKGLEKIDQLRFIFLVILRGLILTIS